MARTGGLGLRCWLVAWGTRVGLCVLGLAVGWSGAVLSAQDAAPQDEPIHTLHVYTNLIQIPTLVLGANRERLKKPIAESRFSVSIDSGRWFRATHVRQEGEDPISLSILLDVSGDEAKLMPKIADAIADLGPLSLHSKDHISIYAMDCSLVRSLNDQPAETGQLKRSVDSALEPWMIRRQDKHRENCKQKVHLWDALAYLAGELYKLPGRRVILAVSEGDDEGSDRTWNEVRTYAQATGVAVFGVTYVPAYATNINSAGRRGSSEDSFRSLCELSGGMVFPTDARSLADTLKRFTTTVRERYIVEFPRPANATSGEHSMEVKVANSADFIRSAGISVPIPDAALLADPATVPSDPKLTPEMGTRHPMTNPQ
jgi:hypothetical protein